MSTPEESPAAELQRKLHIDEALASQLVNGHLETIEEVAYVPIAEFLEVSGLAVADAQSLRRIAALYLLNEGLGDKFGA
jgi:transcription termination/antitermination protein NusA